MSSGNTPYPDAATLRELDRAAGAPKGTAFRCFKRLLPAFEEGVDYVVLHYQNDEERVASLRRRGRIYANSLNVVVLGPRAAQAVAEAMSGDAGAAW